MTTSNNMSATGVFTFETWNVGDEMQSFAILAHVDQVDTFVNRDCMADFQNGQDTNCIFNSWFLMGEDFRRPAECIKPVWYGFCGGRGELLQSDWLTYMREHQPIGCRDTSTAEYLTDVGIEAYWTGCLTLFMGNALANKPKDRQGIVFIDVPHEAEPLIPSEISSRAVRLSTFPPPTIVNDTLERWASVARLVNIIARAELVVTRRLHVALPAASLGTPVVAIPVPEISNARHRFSGFERIIPVIFSDEIETGLRKIDWLNIPPATIPEEISSHYASFSKILRSRKMLGQKDLHVSTLDDLTRQSVRLRNVTSLMRPGRIRLKLNDRSFEVNVLEWSDRYIDVRLSCFPGLAKFNFQVEASAWNREEWICWGALRDLVL